MHLTAVSVPRPPVPEGADEDWVVSDRIGHQLIRLIRLVERRHPGKVGPDGVEKAAYVLLARLVLEGPRRSNALAEAVHSDPSTVSRQVAALVRVGLVERRSDPDDGRACLLAATPEGLRVFEANRDRRNRELTALIADWDPADRVVFVDLLQRFVGGLEQRADAEVPPGAIPTPTPATDPAGPPDAARPTDLAARGAEENR